MKKILALDQSTSKTGFAIFFSDGGLGNWGIIRPSKKLNENNMISMFLKIVEKIQKEKPDVVLLEDVYLKKGKTFNIQTHKTLSNLQGMLISYFILNQIEYKIIHPSTWKNKVIGKKKVTKEETQSFLNKKYEIIFKEDEADAVAIGLYYMVCEKIYDDNFNLLV